MVCLQTRSLSTLLTYFEGQISFNLFYFKLKQLFDTCVCCNLRSYVFFTVVANFSLFYIVKKMKSDTDTLTRIEIFLNLFYVSLDFLHKQTNLVPLVCLLSELLLHSVKNIRSDGLCGCMSKLKLIPCLDVDSELTYSFCLSL